MKSKTLTLIGLFTLVASSVFAASTWEFTLPGTTTLTSGATYGPNDTFSLSIRVNWDGTNPTPDFKSFSFFLEVPNADATFLSITSQSFSDGSTGSPSSFNTNNLTLADFPQNFTVAGDSGMMRNNDSGSGGGGDLGGTAAAAKTVAGNYYLTTLTFQLNNAPVGTFNLQTYSLSSLANTAGSPSFPATKTYAITIVPEPATWSLLGLGGLASVGLTVLRRRRAS